MKRSYLDLVDVRESGVRDDISPLLRDAEATRAMVRDLVEPFRDAGVTHVAGIDALGFILGAYAAQELGAGFIPVRKGDKLPQPIFSREFIDHLGRFQRLEVRRDAARAGDRLLIVDDWIETGSQMQSAIALLEQTEAQIVGFAALCIKHGEKTDALRERYVCHDLWPSAPRDAS